jgi:hypothetical protein
LLVDEQPLGDLYRIYRGTFAHIIRYDPQRHTVRDRVVSPDTTDVNRI